MSTTTTTALTIQAHVSQPQNVAVEWDARQNKLRVADVTTNETMAVFTNGEVYGVSAAVPDGYIQITDTAQLPGIAGWLRAAGIIKIVKHTWDPGFNQETVTARVLID